jgi:CarD family transcriptional regulator
VEFAIGDHVIHPAHGPGEIVAFQETELVGGFRRYCVIRFFDHGLVMHIPWRRMDKCGLRRVMSGAVCREVLDRLSSVPNSLPSDFKERRRLVETWLATGAPARLADAVRDLAWRRVSKRLNQADSELFEQAHGRLLAELSLALGHSRAEMDQRIRQALDAGQTEVAVAGD